MTVSLARSRWVKAGFVVLAVLVGKELAAHLPDDGASFRAFEVPGELGADVTLRTGVVQASEVRLTSTVFAGDEGYLTPGVWVVVTVTLTPAQERESLAHAAVRSADGVRTWEHRTRAGASCPATPPGIPVTCDLSFEVPPEALAGAELLLATESDQRHDSVAVIDLAVTTEQVEAAADADPVALAEPRVGDGDD